MTFIGKLLLMINLSISLLMAVTAFGLWVGGIDWTDQAGQAGKPAGKMAALRKQIDDTLAKLPVAEGSWKAARADLLVREDRRLEDRKWYDAEMAKLGSGNDPVKTAVSSTATLGGKLTMVDALDTTGQPLQTRGFYDAKLKEHQSENRKLREDLEKKVTENEELVKQLFGDRDTDPEPRKRGIRRQIVEEQDKRRGITDEQGITESLQINGEIQSELIFKRLQSLDERIRELGRYLKRKHGVDVPEKWR